MCYSPWSHNESDTAEQLTLGPEDKHWNQRVQLAHISSREAADTNEWVWKGRTDDCSHLGLMGSCSWKQET